MSLVQNFCQLSQTICTGQFRIGFFHTVHEVLCRPVVTEHFLHFLQIVDLELYGIGLSCPAVSADEQFRSGFQRLPGFGDFSVDGCRRGNLQVAGMRL